MEDYISISELKKHFTKNSSEDSDSTNEDIFTPHPLMIDEKFSGDIISNSKLDSQKLTGIKLAGVKFYKCTFTDADLTGSLFWMTTFQECTFEKCVLDRTVFRKCEIRGCNFIRSHSRFYLNISESYMFSTDFLNCSFDGVEISGTDTFDILFEKCTLSMGRFQANFTYRENLSNAPEKYLSEEDKELLSSEEVYEDVIYENCMIDFMDFRMIDFIDTKFRNCEISKCTFVESQLYGYNIDESNNQKGWGTNTIDLSTLSQSEIADYALKTVFNISTGTRDKINELTQERIINSVFISYSLNDGFIAGKINEHLKNQGVTTFIWEQDALGGQPLKSLMKSNIDSKDRLLFIASENSLKSPACHFELTEGRKKQNRLWKTILFPIHIDDFLFQVEHEQIRPKNKREEFWENIEELREINSLDFRNFKTNTDWNANKKEFESMMSKLIESLKIE